MIQVDMRVKIWLFFMQFACLMILIITKNNWLLIGIIGLAIPQFLPEGK